MRGWRKLPAGCEKQMVFSSPQVLAWESIRACLTFVGKMASGVHIPRSGTTAFRSKTWQILRDLRSIPDLHGAFADTV
jgi:hypothetical protein